MTDPMAELQKRFKQNVILMVVGDEDVVDYFRKIFICVSGDLAFVGVAQNRVQ